MIILLHSSKTMRNRTTKGMELTVPVLLNKAAKLQNYIVTLKPTELQTSMKISAKLAETTLSTYKCWPAETPTAAATCFLGDIYSGLQSSKWSPSDWNYANKHLRILSGLYGILRPADGIKPYRLEMGYGLPAKEYQNLYKYWGEDIADTLPKSEKIINLAADEYSRTITAFWNSENIISPKFLTINPKTGKPTFVVVHAKIARGAFANWLIKNKLDNMAKLSDFNELGYIYSDKLSTKQAPVYICKKFQGLGLSVRLS